MSGQIAINLLRKVLHLRRGCLAGLEQRRGSWAGPGTVGAELVIGRTVGVLILKLW